MLTTLTIWYNGKSVAKTYARVFHTTRMVPRRVPDLLDNGSIYWVIKRQIRVRQQITDIEEFTDDQAFAGVTCILTRRWC